MSRPSLLSLCPGLLSLCLTVAACSDGETAPTTAVTTVPPPSTTQAHEPPPPFQEVTVGVAADGSHLVDSDGSALYAFTLDTERTSTCEGRCAEAWPPLLGDPVAADGVDQSLLGNAERSNGAIQVTYAGRPLYRYSGDTQPGDTNGHGFNDVWFLVAPDGDLVAAG